MPNQDQATKQPKVLHLGATQALVATFFTTAKTTSHMNASSVQLSCRLCGAKCAEFPNQLGPILERTLGTSLAFRNQFFMELWGSKLPWVVAKIQSLLEHTF